MKQFLPVLLVAMAPLVFISCKKNGAEKPAEIVKDIDGNTYETVQIGTQVWMKQNLRTSRYRDGSSINGNLTANQWKDTKEGASASPFNDPSLEIRYGKLYNGYAVINPKGLCPQGWHVPSQEEWHVLLQFLGSETIAGGHMKATSEWLAPNTGATNSSGFSAYPAGSRDGASGNFSDKKNITAFWSSTPDDLNRVLAISIRENSEVAGYTNGYGKNYGLSCRCIRD